MTQRLGDITMGDATRDDLIQSILQCDEQPWSPSVAQHRATLMAALTRRAVTDFALAATATNPLEEVTPSAVLVVPAAAPPAVPTAAAPARAATPAPPGTFRDRNQALGELAREVKVLREHNLKFKEGDPQTTLLMFAEAAIVCMTMEHFVRVVVANHLHPEPPPRMELFNLLEYAVAENLISLPWSDQADGIRRVCNVRNSLLHGNFAQAARDANCSSVDEYFKTQYASETEAMFKIANFLMGQINPDTGRPVRQ